MMMRSIWRVFVGLVLNRLVVATAGAEDELKALLDRVLAHDIKPAAGFTAKVIVPSGQMYDPHLRQARAAGWIYCRNYTVKEKTDGEHYA